MRNKEVLGLTLLVLLLVFLTHATIAQAVVPDANLANGIRRDLGLPPNSPLTPQDLQGLFRLLVGGAEITDITGLEHATNLRLLGLKHNQISDIAPLAKLTNLRVLDLQHNQISDIAPLAKLTQLKTLELQYNRISDITPLADLRQLEYLYVGGREISDITPLAKLTQLKTLEIWGSKVSDFTPLAGLGQLEHLYVAGSEISDITPFAKLTQVKKLALWGNKISDITLLAGLRQLETLYLTDNDIRDIAPLAKLTNLRVLDLSGNEISDITLLVGLRQLEVLYLKGNLIADETSLQRLLRSNPNLKVDIQPVPGLIPDGNLAEAIRERLSIDVGSPLTKHDLNRLTFLSASNSGITDITGLEHATQLETLYLWDNQISDITPLAGLRQLEYLSVGLSDISDFTPLTKLTQLKTLVLRSNKISDITLLVGLRQLETLDLQHNQISDITPLAKLTNLRELDLRRNQISDITPLAGLRQLETLYLKGNFFVDETSLQKLLRSNPNLKMDVQPVPGLMPDGNLADAIRKRLSIDVGSPLTKHDLNRLTSLYNIDSGITDLTGLEHATQLERLDLAYNQISDITLLVKLTNLTQLDLSGNEISDLSPFAKLTNLTQLDLAYNQISDINPLAKLTNLTQLDLAYNQISDITPLADLRQLEELRLKRNPIDGTSLQKLLRNNPNLKVDVQPVPGLMPDANLAAEVRGQLRLELGSPLTKHDLNRLTVLFAFNASITNITGLEHATQLKGLYLSGNQISDITPLTKLTQLETLDINFNEISDITPIAKLTNLRRLDLHGNEINDTGPIRQLLQRNPNLKLDIDLDAGPKIEGPWVWMIVPTDQKSDGKATASEKDWLKAASKGRVTEQQMAINGARPGDIIGNKVWTLGKIAPINKNNIPNTVNAIGLGTGDTINNHVAYGSISLNSPRKQKTRMYVGSSQDVKVWLNGVLVHNNSGEPPTGGYRDVASVTLKQGKNILLVAVYQTRGHWNGFFGFKNDAVYSLSTTPTVHISEAQRPPMYWIATNAGTLHRLIGDEVEDMLPNVQNVTSLAVDSAVRSLYWTEKTGKRTGKIKRANLDGSNIKLIKDLTSVPLNIALDSAARKLYLINAYGKIQRLNLDGSNFQPNLITDLKSPNYLTLDVTGSKIYWTEQTGNMTGKIQRANLDGTNVELLKALTSVPHGLAIDPANNKLYLLNAYGKIQRLNLDGSNFQPNLITDLDAPQSLAVDSVGGKVYWIEQGSIRRANRNGKNIQNVVSGLGAPANIVLGSVPAATAAAPARVREMPAQTVLLANYPNPFNPETWIPYQLAEPSDVKITIYNTHGLVVRQLALGHQPAGTYTSRSRAAYWDGRNSQGERVASGIYFYQFQTDNVLSLRKMLILK